MLLALSVALAGPYVTSVSEEQPLGVGGGWGRIFLNDDDATAFRFLWAAGGDYVLLPMGADLTIADTGRTELTGRTNLVDHAITRCPDGTFLHGASANIETPNDSAFAFRYDADLGLTAEGTIEERVEGVPHNDLAVLCSGVVDGVAFAAGGRPGEGGSVFVPFAEDGTVGTPITLENGASMMGGSLYYEAETDSVLAVNFDFEALRVARYTTDLDHVETLTVDAAAPGLRGYWAQGLMRVGDTYILAHMARDDGEGWAADEGDVWLTFLDTDWNVLDRQQISQNTPPLGGMRPGIARRGDQLLVTYDKEVQPRLFEVRLDLAALGVEGAEDSGFVVDDDDTGDDGTGGTDPVLKCGCATGGVPTFGGALLALGAALGARRRR